MTLEQQRAIAMARARQRAAAAQQNVPQGTPPDPTVGGTLRFGPLDTGLELPDWASRGLSGAGKAFADIGRGAGQMVGAVSQGDVDEAKRTDAALMNTGAGQVGNVLGNIAATAPAMMIPGVNTVRGGAMLGAALGGSQPVASGESRLANTAMGAAGGAGGAAIGGGLARVARPNTRPDVRALIDEGAQLTPGQIMGGIARTTEDKLTSVPLLGDAIASGQRRSVESVNRAAYNRALEPIGERSTATVGHEAVREVQQQLSRRYDALLPNLSFSADGPFIQELVTIRQMGRALPPQRATQFENILQDKVLGKMTQFGRMNGESFKEVESDLIRLAKDYRSSADPDQRHLGDALNEVVSSMKRGLARSNPDNAAELNAINEGWANYARIRGAAGTQGAAGRDGVFTPEQLSASVRAQDKSAGKSQFAQGRAMMQDLSGQARNVIGNRYPDSGTAGRGLLAQLAAIPTLPILAAGSLPYTGMGQRLTQAALAQRPQQAEALARALRSRYAMAPLATSGAAFAYESQ